ncbi:MAG: DegV family protein [Lachnospiraceae bacterium]|nr:DegV family protein [Lachnospiraceae bacterium]
MSFLVFADGTANLPKKMTDGIRILPCGYLVDGRPEIYDGDLEHFDAHAYYNRLREGMTVQTSLLGLERFLSVFDPVLEQGIDIIYVSMSSGISGTYNVAWSAGQELMEKYPGRTVHVVDSKGCGLGSGLLAVRAAGLGRQGIPAGEAGEILDREVIHACQYFTVDDLGFLKRTGRVSGVAANFGTILNIKPILYGDTTGHIVPCDKVRGRRKAVEMLASKYREKKTGTQDLPVCISHGDCIEDAERLADLIKSISPEVEICICEHEPVSGSHVGPGMLGLFFRGVTR